MSLFSNPASGSNKKFKQQQQYIQKQGSNISKNVNVNVDKYTNQLDDLSDQLDSGGLLPTSLRGTAGGLTGSIDYNGNTVLNRTAGSQGFMDRLLSGFNRDEEGYSALLGRMAPAHSELQDILDQAFGNAKTKAVGDVQANLAKRRVLGASFANDQMSSVARQYDQDLAEAKAQAKIQELQMTEQVLNSRTTARLNNIKTGFDQINYETGVGATLWANTQNNMMKIQDALVDLAKTGATIGSQAAIAKASIQGNLAGIGAQGFPQLADLQAQGKAAQQQSIGSVIGAGLGMFNFGGVGGGTQPFSNSTGGLFGIGHTVGPSGLVP